MNPYLSSASLKTMARGQLLGKYGTVVGAYLLHMLCTYPLILMISFLINPNTLDKIILYLIISFAVSVFSGFFIAGEAFIYLKIACNQPVFVKDLFTCFRGETNKVLSIQAVVSGISVLGSAPYLIAGNFLDLSNPDASVFLVYVVLFLFGMAIEIVSGLLFSQAFYLMLDFPDYDANKLLKTSIQMMKGNMGRLFYIQISFVPLMLLSIFSCGIGLLWLLPYMQATKTNFYLDLIKKNKTSNVSEN